MMRNDATWTLLQCPLSTSQNRKKKYDRKETCKDCWRDSNVSRISTQILNGTQWQIVTMYKELSPSLCFLFCTDIKDIWLEKKKLPTAYLDEQAPDIELILKTDTNLLLYFWIFDSYFQYILIIHTPVDTPGTPTRCWSVWPLN